MLNDEQNPFRQKLNMWEAWEFIYIVLNKEKKVKVLQVLKVTQKWALFESSQNNNKFTSSECT